MLAADLVIVGIHGTLSSTEWASMLELEVFSANQMDRWARGLYFHPFLERQSFEGVAQFWVQEIYNALTHYHHPAFALIRIYRLGQVKELPTELAIQCHDCHDRVLYLMGSAGDEQHWNRRQDSRHHQVISYEAAQKRPMFQAAFDQLSLEDDSVIHPDLDIEISRNGFYNYFWVEHAQQNSAIPYQKDFVLPYHIHSVFGLGGKFLSGNAYLLLMFAKIQLSPPTQQALRAIAPYVATSLARCDGHQDLWG